MSALGRSPREAPVSQFMQRQFESAEPTEMLNAAFERLQSCECYTMPVLRGGQLVGLLTMDNVGEFIAIRKAIEEKQSAAVRNS